MACSTFTQSAKLFTLIRGAERRAYLGLCPLPSRGNAPLQPRGGGRGCGVKSPSTK